MASRWIRQRNFYSCGPVALLNLSKWLGEKVTYANDYLYWFDKCSCSVYGSSPTNFVQALYSIENIKITPRSIPTMCIIDESLKKNRAIVMKSASLGVGEFWGENRIVGHYYLITERSKDSFFCVNYDEHEHIPSAPFKAQHGWIKKSFFKQHFLKYHTNFCDDCGVAPYAWIIRKT